MPDGLNRVALTSPSFEVVLVDDGWRRTRGQPLCCRTVER